MLNKIFFSTLSFAVIAGFAPAFSATSTAEPTETTRSLVQDAPAALSRIAEKRVSSAEAMDALGLPKDLRREEKWVGSHKEVLTELTYPESVLMFVKSSAGDRERLVYLKTQNESYEPVPGVQVGDRFAAAQKALPRLEQVEAYTYQQCDQWQRGDCIRLRVHEGEVVQVEQMFVMD